jgi:glycine cleavage system aminomethyltransferase T
LDKLEQLRWIVEGRLRQSDSPDRQAAYRHVLEDIGQLRGNTYLFESPRGRFVATLEAENAEKLRQELQKALKTVEELVEYGADLAVMDEAYAEVVKELDEVEKKALCQKQYQSLQAQKKKEQQKARFERLTPEQQEAAIMDRRAKQKVYRDRSKARKAQEKKEGRGQ